LAAPPGFLGADGLDWNRRTLRRRDLSNLTALPPGGASLRGAPFSVLPAPKT